MKSVNAKKKIIIVVMLILLVLGIAFICIQHNNKNTLDDKHPVLTVEKDVLLDSRNKPQLNADEKVLEHPEVHEQPASPEVRKKPEPSELLEQPASPEVLENPEPSEVPGQITQSK